MKNVILENKLVRMLTLTSVLLLSVFTAQADVILSFDESDIEVNLNETFTISLFAETELGADSFSLFSVDLNDFSSILSDGSFALGSDFLDTPIGFIYSSAFGTAVGSNVLLGKFTFTAINYGAITLETISESFSVLGINTILSDSASANISVVSTPARLGLFAIALAGLVSLRRKA
jgi:hypothetical protein